MINQVEPYVFTTALVQNGRVKWFAEHIDRLVKHANLLQLGSPAFGLIEKKVAPFLHKEPCLVKIMINTDGVRVESREAILPLSSDYDQGVKIILTGSTVNSTYSTFKTNFRACYEQASNEVKVQSAFEGLLTDVDGFIVDGTRTSPLFFDGNTLFSIEGGIQGVTREKVLQSAVNRGLHVKRARVTPHELKGTLLIAGSGIGLLGSQPVEDPRIKALIQEFRLI